MAKDQVDELNNKTQTIIIIKTSKINLRQRQRAEKFGGNETKREM